MELVYMRERHMVLPLVSRFQILYLGSTEPEFLPYPQAWSSPTPNRPHKPWIRETMYLQFLSLAPFLKAECQGL